MQSVGGRGFSSRHCLLRLRSEKGGQQINNIGREKKNVRKTMLQGKMKNSVKGTSGPDDAPSVPAVAGGKKGQELAGGFSGEKKRAQNSA